LKSDNSLGVLLALDICSSVWGEENDGKKLEKTNEQGVLIKCQSFIFMIA
jgi:hypothetical protein